jgi:hypothetical protein
MMCETAVRLGLSFGKRICPTPIKPYTRPTGNGIELLDSLSH